MMDYDEKIQILRACSSKKGERCSSCPAFGKGNRNCMRNAMKDAANAIERLQADLARMTAERDAAVEDLEEIMFKGGHNIDTCHFCTNGQCYGRGGTQVCEPKWRGQKEN